MPDPPVHDALKCAPHRAALPPDDRAEPAPVRIARTQRMHQRALAVPEPLGTAQETLMKDRAVRIDHFIQKTGAHRTVAVFLIQLSPENRACLGDVEHGERLAIQEQSGRIARRERAQAQLCVGNLLVREVVLDDFVQAKPVASKGEDQPHHTVFLRWCKVAAIAGIDGVQSFHRLGFEPAKTVDDQPQRFEILGEHFVNIRVPSNRHRIPQHSRERRCCTFVSGRWIAPGHDDAGTMNRCGRGARLKRAIQAAASALRISAVLWRL